MAKVCKFIPVCVVLIFAAGSSAVGRLEGREVDHKRLAQIRQQMQAFVDQQQIAGAVTLVGNHEEIYSLEAVGQRDIEKGLPMQKDSIFRIASMTKPITAIAIMTLVDEGKIDVDDPVENYLPEFKGQMLISERKGDAITLKKPARPITVRDLLTHTSGMPGSPPAGLADLYVRRNHTLAEGVMAYSQRPLEFEPGSKWSYCNTGIDTLGRIVEAVSGTSFEMYLHENVFTPLGMTDTFFYPRSEIADRIAATYNVHDGKLVRAPDAILGMTSDPRYPVPAGGLYSTASDLAKVYQMMLRHGVGPDDRVLSVTSVDTMTQLQTGDLACGFVPGMGFGFGWAVVKEPQGVTGMLSKGTYGHGGAFGTQAWIDPERELFVILLIQRTGLPNGDASDFRKTLQETAFSAVK
ncbi:MAG TPA: serine hydrolase domain-containing protein [Planctomycetaceae bacterium]|nr:serine hydrolase domain-containing protein [Planctomycetaceae bacterium]